MTQERLGILLDKYEKGQCTPEELQELDDFYENLDGSDSHQELPGYIADNWESFADQEYKNLKNAIGNVETSKKVWKIQPLKIAAVMVGLIGLALLSLYIYKNSFSHVNNKLPAVVSNEVKSEPIADNQHLQLPDGSIVILHAGSTLKMDSLTFNVATREVELTGEAYFDIKHNPAKPFIVHAGKAKVTVLGTAFNVVSNQAGLQVTVTRGKVKVEENGKADVLTPNQQLVYHEEKAIGIKQVDAAETVNWIKTGLTFNNERLDSIAHRLERRYNIDIKLSSDAVGDCRVSAGNPFNGTETPQEILSLICPAINASFRQDGSTIIIDGTGCEHP